MCFWQQQYMHSIAYSGYERFDIMNVGNLKLSNLTSYFETFTEAVLTITKPWEIHPISLSRILTRLAKSFLFAIVRTWFAWRRVGNVTCLYIPATCSFWGHRGCCSKLHIHVHGSRFQSSRFSQGQIETLGATKQCTMLDIVTFKGNKSWIAAILRRYRAGIFFSYADI